MITVVCRVRRRGGTRPDPRDRLADRPGSPTRLGPGGLVGAGLVPPLVLIEGRLVVVAVPGGFPAGRGQILGPRIGLVRVVGGDVFPRLPVRVQVGGVAGQQILQPGRVGDDADGFRHPHRPGILIAFLGQAFGDPLVEGQHHRHIPGLTAGDQGAQSFFGLGGADLPFRRRQPFPFPIRLLIHLQDGGVQGLQETRPRQLHHPAAGLLIHLTSGRDRQLGGQGGDLAGLPVVHLPGHHPFPQPWQPVPDRQRVTHPGLRRWHRGAERTHQAVRGELRHLRCPGRPDRDESLDQQPTVGMIDLGMRVRPGGSDHQLPATPVPLLLLDVGGQISQGVPVAQRRLQLIIEHT